ncbi:MAG TPA: hypothetical protein VEW04_09540 [Allosphingosinicella sp.]|nr:hypothetical protein [Allosphingosinicella sp.]
MSDDKKRGSGHPLPHSAEAHSGEVPEHLVREKGLGEDAQEASQAESDLVGPDGETYGLKPDQAAHQDRGQGWIEKEDGGS